MPKLIGNPDPIGKRIPVMLRLPERQHQVLTDEARKANLSVNAALVQIIDFWIGENLDEGGAGEKPVDHRGVDGSRKTKKKVSVAMAKKAAKKKVAVKRRKRA